MNNFKQKKKTILANTLTMSLLIVISTILRVKFSRRPSSPNRKLPVNPSKSDCWTKTKDKVCNHHQELEEGN